MQIKPTHYSIRSRFDEGSNNHYPKNWIVELSNDGSTWVIDERCSNNDVNGKNLTRRSPFPRVITVDSSESGIRISVGAALIIITIS
jgi:hypothetical protein